MADGKRSTLARRSRPANKVVTSKDKVNIALPLSMIRAEEPMTMRVGDWISLAGLAVSVIGFSVAITELIRIAKASEANRRAIGPAESKRLHHGPPEQARRRAAAPRRAGSAQRSTPVVSTASAAGLRTVRFSGVADAKFRSQRAKVIGC